MNRGREEVDFSALARWCGAQCFLIDGLDWSPSR
jgi:hypothetical protein